MFDRNDRYALIANKIVNIVSIIGGIVGILFGIYIVVIGALSKDWIRSISGVVIAIAVALGAVIFWAFAHMLIAYFIDIKLIRNKMYDADNNNLATTIEDGVEVIKENIQIYSNDSFDKYD